MENKFYMSEKNKEIIEAFLKAYPIKKIKSKTISKDGQREKQR